MGSWLHQVCTCFVIILKFYFFSTVRNMGGGEKVWVLYGGGCSTDVVLHSSKNYHQGHATEPNLRTSQPLGAL